MYTKHLDIPICNTDFFPSAFQILCYNTFEYIVTGLNFNSFFLYNKGSISRFLVKV